MNFRRVVLFIIILLQITFLTEGYGILGPVDTTEFNDSLHATLLPQHAIKTIPPGNYSGITYLGNDDYAVVTDKGQHAGFYTFHITLTANGDIQQVENKGFTMLAGANNDEEAIAYNPLTKHLYIDNEASSEIIDYDMKSQKTVNRAVISDYQRRCHVNRSIESLTFDRRRNRLFTMNESPLIGDNGLLVRLKQLTTDLKEEKEYSYLIDEPLESPNKADNRHAYGVADLLALDDGTILVLERELYIRALKLNSWVMNKIFRIKPGNPRKQFVAGWRTWLRLVDSDFANYEGMCEGPRLSDGRHVIVFCADSQDRYKGVLKDYFRTIVF